MLRNFESAFVFAFDFAFEFTLFGIGFDFVYFFESSSLKTQENLRK